MPPILIQHCFELPQSLRLAVLVLIAASALVHNASLGGNTLSLCKGGARDPVLALRSRLHLVVHLINLLERVALGLVYEEIDEGNADEAESEPDEEDLGLQVGITSTVVDKVRGRVSDGPVEKPLDYGVSGLICRP